MRALLASPGLKEQTDSVRLAAVVLMARTPVTTGVVEIRKAELGRWCGTGRDNIKHVVRSLRGVGLRGDVQPVAVSVPGTAEGAEDSLRLRILPLWHAMSSALGPAGRCPQTREWDPLALDRRELAVLFHLVEHLFAPGWSFRDGRDPVLGLLAGRTGRGASTDRLALLLMVLSASARGRVRLCGGRVDTHVGRPAVTLARMLSCSPAGAAHVLVRLEESGVLTRPRRGASGLRSRARIVIPAVAAAYQADNATAPVGLAAPVLRSVPQSAAARTKASSSPKSPQPSVAREWPSADHWWGFYGEPELEEPPVADPALEDGFDTDLGFVGCPAAATPPESGPDVNENAQATGMREAERPAASDLAAATPLHSLHSPVAEVGGRACAVDGFSGACAVVAEDVRPERTVAREDRPGDVTPPLTAAPSPAHPLRGDQPNPNSADPQQRKQTRRRDRHLHSVTPAVAPPADLAQVLAPALSVWERLDRPYLRDQVAFVVRKALGRIMLWSGPRLAVALLAGRLTERLRQQGGPALVTDPYGWLIRKGLTQRQVCGSAACDDGIDLTWGGDCASCDGRLADRRSLRRALIAQVVAATPDAAFEDRGPAIDVHLRQHAEQRAAELAADLQRAETDRKRSEERQAQREAQRLAAQLERQELPCSQCGAERSAGLCTGCSAQQAARAALTEAVDLELAGGADLSDRASVRELMARAGRRLDAAILRERATNGLGEDADTESRALSDMVTTQNCASIARAWALRELARNPQAREEGQMAHDAVMRAAHRYDSRTAAKQEAVAQGQAAVRRAAEYLLARRLETIAKLRECGRPTLPPAPSRRAVGVALAAAEAGR
ncbi:hypothetical protein PUR61_16980 [Streptomyces sp. BE20]|uniref:hypothetical protein n=1 Tax=Streptomyces sp. BE20 TaxID=3002525 RepID=UPI002E791FD6|nr:hypothetical protein [Streptomyces sp. BE20]MEE1823872.1 hypothetical protein [Streptomyces sp. BE20]